MFYGKVIAGLIGLLVGGVFGLCVGVIVGHFFDRGLANVAQLASPENLQRVQHRFAQTAYTLMGYMAKADGRVSEAEIAHAEAVFSQFRLNPDQRKQAINWFQQGARSDFNLQGEINTFMQECGGILPLRKSLLSLLLSVALADGELHHSERDAFKRIGGLLNIGELDIERFIRMAQAQSQFNRHGGAGETQSGGSLADAYAALGVDENATDADVKKAYRKLMSANHPDKLIAQGVPEHMVKLATEKSQDIQAAYERVKKSRG